MRVLAGEAHLFDLLVQLHVHAWGTKYTPHEGLKLEKRQISGSWGDLSGSWRKATLQFIVIFIKLILEKMRQ